MEPVLPFFLHYNTISSLELRIMRIKYIVETVSPEEVHTMFHLDGTSTLREQTSFKHLVYVEGLLIIYIFVLERE